MKRGRNDNPLWMPWHEWEFENDETVMQMTIHQEHLYRRLLQKAFVCATAPDLPDNDGLLWRVAGADSLEDWNANKELILTKFERTVQDGKPALRHKRLEFDHENARAASERIRKARSEAGRKGGRRSAQVRWGHQTGAAGDSKQNKQTVSKSKPSCSSVSGSGSGSKSFSDSRSSSVSDSGGTHALKGSNRKPETSNLEPELQGALPPPTPAELAPKAHTGKRPRKAPYCLFCGAEGHWMEACPELERETEFQLARAREFDDKEARQSLAKRLHRLRLNLKICIVCRKPAVPDAIYCEKHNAEPEAQGASS